MNKTVHNLPSLGFPLFQTSLVTGSQIEDLKRGIGMSDDHCDPIAWINHAVACGQKLVSVKAGWGELPTGL